MKYSTLFSILIFLLLIPTVSAFDGYSVLNNQYVSPWVTSGENMTLDFVTTLYDISTEHAGGIIIIMIFLVIILGLAITSESIGVPIIGMLFAITFAGIMLPGETYYVIILIIAAGVAGILIKPLIKKMV